MTSNRHGNFYCINCLCCSYNTKNALKNHEERCNKHNYCYPIMPNKYNNILEYKHREKSLKGLFVIELGIECILKKEHSYQNNFEKSYTERKAMHELSGWEMFTKCLFDSAKNKLDYYRGTDCIKELCKKLKDHAIEILN